MNYDELLAEAIWRAGKRKDHIVGCCREAGRLAKRWGVQEETALCAAAMHDITKGRKLGDQLKLCKKYGIVLDEIQQKEPSLLHALTGAALGADFYGLSAEVCSAIRWHTTGRPNMEPLDKIVFLADMVEPSREFSGVDELRALSYSNIDYALRVAIASTVASVLKKGRLLHHDSVAAYNFLLLT